MLLLISVVFLAIVQDDVWLQFTASLVKKKLHAEKDASFGTVVNLEEAFTVFTAAVVVPFILAVVPSVLAVAVAA